MQRRCIRAVAVAAGLAAATAMAACAASPGDEPSVGQVTSDVIGGDTSQCPESGCGGNSPQVSTNLEFHELSLDGDGQPGLFTTPNDQGLSIVTNAAQRAQIVQGAQSYDLHVVNGEISGSCAPPCVPLAHSDLKGATFTMTLFGKPAYQVSIDGVRPMPFFVNSQQAESYSLTYKSLTTTESGWLCNNVDAVIKLLDAMAYDDSYAPQELMNMKPWETVVFEGDRVKAVAKTMSQTADDNWFNIGCATHLLAKLYLTRNTIHTQAAMARPWESRQATMKMLAADYCGGGIPNTVAGQRLVWKGDLMTYYSTPDSLEARWTQDGAICLTTPRMKFPTTDLGRKLFKGYEAKIAASCKAVGKSRPLPCPDPRPATLLPGLRVSSNPVL